MEMSHLKTSACRKVNHPSRIAPEFELGLGAEPIWWCLRTLIKENVGVQAALISWTNGIGNSKPPQTLRL